jgi:predicted TIM-barrel fold metal-dependent hydrolase
MISPAGRTANVPMILDIHCHYTLTRQPATVADRFRFEPAPAGATGPGRRPRPTDFDSCVSPRALRRWSWRVARRCLRLPNEDAELDRRLVAEYAQHLYAAGPIDRYVLLAFDAVHDDDGRCPPLPHARHELGSDIYTSNSLVRDLCRRHPQRFLFGASVHPYRPNAAACVEEVFAAGACLLKWIPLHQNIDLADARTLAVLRQCAALGLPVLVHCGDEFTLTTQRPAHRPVRPLLEALGALRREGCMPCTIVPHAATPVSAFGDRDSHRLLLEALTGEFADAPLYADIAALVTWVKTSFLRQLARRQELHSKLLFGSDFPVPPLLHRLRRDLGRAYGPLKSISSWPQRAAEVCRAFGFNEIVFRRAAELLPHVDFFAGRAGSRTA